MKVSILVWLLPLSGGCVRVNELYARWLLLLDPLADFGHDDLLSIEEDLD